MKFLKECMTTHDQTKVGAVPVCRLAEVDALVRDFDVVGIDEGQFYEDLVEYCEAYHAKKEGRRRLATSSRPSS